MGCIIINWRDLLLIKTFRLVKTLGLDKIFSMDKIPIFKGKTCLFSEYFKGFEKVEAVRQVFGDKTEEVLSNNIIVEYTWIGGYMWVNNANGHLMVSSRYLKTVIELIYILT